MIFKQIKPTTPSKRQLLRLNEKFLDKKPILKKKIVGKKNLAGKNHSGKITIFHRGNGVKNKYRQILFNQTLNFSGVVCSLEYDPNRSAYLASIHDYINNQFFYVIAPQNLKIGDIIKSGTDIKPSLGCSLPLEEIPIGTPIYNVSIKPKQPAKLSRAAGTFSLLRSKTDTHAVIELSSNKYQSIPLNSFAAIGKVSREFYFLIRKGKAGQSRWLNIRPTVRGVAMNPIDHPHGGGEGKKSGKNLTPWGKPNSKKTRKINHFSTKIQ